MRIVLIIIMLLLSIKVHTQSIHSMYMEIQRVGLDGVQTTYGDVIWGIHRDTIAFLMSPEDNIELVRCENIGEEALEYTERLLIYRREKPEYIIHLFRDTKYQEIYMIVRYDSEDGVIIWITNLQNSFPSYCLVSQIKEK